PMNGHMLANDIVVADLEAGGLVVVLQVLRRIAEDGVAIDLVVTSHRQRADQVRSHLHQATSAQANFPLDDDIRTDLDVLADVGPWIDQGGRMNASRGSNRHMTPC